MKTFEVETFCTLRVRVHGCALMFSNICSQLHERSENEYTKVPLYMYLVTSLTVIILS